MRRPGLVLVGLVVAIAAALAVPAVPHQAASASTSTITVMPLGDSITEARAGTDGSASYRYWLWQHLQAGGYSTDFVGSNQGVSGGSPRFGDFDQDHEGHWGWSADEILAGIGGWADTYRPQVVLMHLGHNDVFRGQSTDSTVSELGQIIDRLRVANPSVTVLVAQIIPSRDAYTDQPIRDLNSRIPGLAAAKSTSASPVVVVDQWSGFDAQADTYDGVHPNESGEKKIAAKWYAALAGILTPSSTTTSTTSTTTTAPAGYSVTAPASVAPGATFTVTFTKPNAGYPLDWIALYRDGANPPDYLQWKYLNNTQTGPSTGIQSGTITMTMPANATGNYRLRLHQNDYSSVTLAISAPVCATGCGTTTTTTSTTTTTAPTTTTTSSTTTTTTRPVRGKPR